MSKRKKSDAQDGEALDRAMYLAARSLGWFIEKTEAEVRSSEAAFDEELVVFPDSLNDPLAGIDRPRQRRGRVRPPSMVPDEELQEGFARAAREGRSGISADVEERMTTDRERAEAARSSDNDDS